MGSLAEAPDGKGWVMAENMKELALKKFEEVFGGAQGVNVYFAPGRVNMIGEHTDYNGGHVFPCALTIGTYGAARILPASEA